MEIEIFEEDGNGTLTFGDCTFDVYPETKTYQSMMSLEYDYYTDKFEYRIKTNPIKVETRLIEQKHEPPERYSVKDGVVLESAIRKEREGKDWLDFITSTDELIDGLKKEVEWHEGWAGNPVSMYILSKHPEIITPNDHRRYLRQLSEKIKDATLKVEMALKSDETGLQIMDESEDLDIISYPKTKRDVMSEAELESAREHLNKVLEQLFEEKSEKYVGISYNEFRSGKEVLERVEFFLNKKPTINKQDDIADLENEDIPNLKNNVINETSSGFKFNVFLFVIQWFWLFIVISFALWLISLIVTIIQYNFTFAFFASGILALFRALLRNK